MGDIADMYREWEFYYGMDDEFSVDREEELASRGIWPAKSGDISVAKMSNDHLSNALAYIEKIDPDSPLQSMLESEINKRKKTSTTKIGT